MKTNLFLCFAAAGFLLAQGCSKNQVAKPSPAASSAKPLKGNVISGSYGAYEITNVAGGLAMEVYGGSLSNGGPIDQYTYYAGGTSGAVNPAFNNQVWQVIDQGTGYYKIMNLRSGKYLEAAFPGPQLWQNKDDGLDAELWQITAVGFGAYKIINKANGLAATNHGSSTSSGTAITEETFAGTSSQYWVFTPVSASAYRDDAVVNFFHRTSGSEVFDGGASVPLTWSSNNGKVLWVTNDVLYNQVNSSGELACGAILNYRNSALIQPASHTWDQTQTTNITSPDGVQIFHDGTANRLLWPGAGIEVGQHVYVHNVEIQNGGLTATNQFLCDITQSTSTSIGSVNNITVPGMSGQTAITYSLGMVKPGDGYVYAYGTGGFIGAGVYVARFPTGSPSSWTFWNGTSWVSTPTDATAAQVANGPCNNNTVGYVNGKYVLVEMDFGFSCDEAQRNVYTLTATSPTGPFSNKKTVFIVPDGKQGHYNVFYNPTIHAEFNNGHNELLVDYCLNYFDKNDGTGGTCLTPCSNSDGTEDPSDGQPKAIRIPYSLIGL